MRARGTRLIILVLLLALELFILYAPHAHAQTVFDPATDVFFEYGAESGLLQPPFSPIGVSPGGTYCARSSDPSGTWVTREKVRTGSYALKDYIHPPPQNNPCRRIHNQWWGNTHDEFYFSVWVYFPSSSTWDVLESGGMGDTWCNVGGNLRTYFGPPSNPWKYSTGMAWCVFRNTGMLRAQWNYQHGFHNQEDGLWDYPLYVQDILDQWVQLQIYYKFHPTNGAYHAWVTFENGTERDLGGATGKITDPRGYSDWGSDWEFRPIESGHVYLQDSLYQDYGMKSVLKYTDDMVASTTKVPDWYGVGYQSLEFEGWEDGFESGNFSAWNGAQVSDTSEAWAKVTSTYAYEGSYSANFTADGTEGSYARAMHPIQDLREVFQRSYVRFEDLLLTDNTRIMVLRVGDEDGTFIANAGLFKNSTGYYWTIRVDNGENGVFSSYTYDASITSDTWYSMEFYVNAAVNGNATLWVDEVEKCEVTGDFSGLGNIARVYPYIYIGDGNQTSAKTVYHDNYRVDCTRIGGARPRRTAVFQASAYFLTAVEDEPVEFSPLEGVRINGTRLTDASGCYEWANLAYNRLYTFAIEKPAGYYPAWVLNVEGSFSWNGTHYILCHNVTETQTSPIEICFSSTEEVYLKSSTHKLTCVSLNFSSENPRTIMRFNITADIGATSRLEIYTADEGHPRPYKIERATDWSYDSENDVLTIWILNTSKEEAEIEWRGAAMGQ